MSHPLHPILVHFPIALLPTAILFEALGALWGRDFFRPVATWLLGLGLLGGIVATLAGLWNEEAVVAAGVPETAIDRHESLAFLTLAVFTVLLAMRWLRGRRWIPEHPAVFFSIGLVGLALLGATGYFGGDLVYRYGAGVERAAPPTPQTENR
jgi:uncharacterized membrane protein